MDIRKVLIINLKWLIYNVDKSNDAFLIIFSGSDLLLVDGYNKNKRNFYMNFPKSYGKN